MTFQVNTSIITNQYNRSMQSRTETRHLVLHSTDDPGASARDLLHYWNTYNADANAHGAIDPTEVLLMLPIDEISWSVGQPANNFTLNFELCMPVQYDPVYFANLWAIATWYFAKLCRDYGRDVSWIKSHDEIRQLYGGTDHTDPVQYFDEYGKTVDDFRADVSKLLTGQATTPSLPFTVAVAQKNIDWLGQTYQIGSSGVQKAAHWLADHYRVAIGSISAGAASTDTSFSVDDARAVILALQAEFAASPDPNVRTGAHWGADALRAVKGLTN